MKYIKIGCFVKVVGRSSKSSISNFNRVGMVVDICDSEKIATVDFDKKYREGVLDGFCIDYVDLKVMNKEDMANERKWVKSLNLIFGEDKDGA
jgi:hypothetical protein